MQGAKYWFPWQFFLSFAVLLTFASCSGMQSTVDVDKHVVINCTFDYLVTGESRRYFAKPVPRRQVTK